MSIDMRTPGVHHFSLRVTDYERAKRFYTEILGFRVLMEIPNKLVISAGETIIGILGPEGRTPAGDRFSPFRVGLDHVALACEDEAEIDRVARAMDEAGIENTGPRIDDTLGKKYVAFKDPDGIAWELYMR
jgi:catechol 2,3-dioxygenase-like lactoylglutathione lyase family enzyme